MNYKFAYRLQLEEETTYWTDTWIMKVRCFSQLLFGTIMGASLSYFVMIHTSVRYQNLALSYRKQIEKTRKFSSEHNLKNIYNAPMVQNKNIRFDNTDFVAENLLVDKLSPELSSSEEVINMH